MPTAKTPPKDDVMMTPEAVAEYLKLTPRWVTREGPQYGLTFYGFGRFKRVRRSELFAWIEQQRQY